MKGYGGGGEYIIHGVKMPSNLYARTFESSSFRPKNWESTGIIIILEYGRVT